MKIKILIVICFFMLGSIKTFALPPETTYLGNIAYQGYYDDGKWGPFNIGFNFTYFGNTYTQFCVTSNGYIAVWHYCRLVSLYQLYNTHSRRSG